VRKGETVSKPLMETKSRDVSPNKDSKQQPLPAIGAAVNYLSQSRNVWVASKISNVNEKRRTVMVACKPGCWIFWPSEILELASEKCEYAVDDDVEYLSSSAKRWLVAKVVAVDGSRIQIDIKPRFWFTSTDQKTCIRPRRKSRRSKLEREQSANSLRLFLMNKQTLRQLADKTFRECDIDHTNGIELSEMRLVISTLAAQLSIEELNDTQLESHFKRFDLEGRGTLDKDQFCEFVESLLQLTLRKYHKVARKDFIQEKGNFESDYTKTKKIGSGSFGEVFLVQTTAGGIIRVAKSIDKVNCKMSARQMEVEIETLKMLDHPHLVKLFEWYPTPNFLYIVMDNAKGGELLQLVNGVYKRGETLQENWVALVVEQSLDAIAYIHSKRLIHRDIKLENILLLNECKTFDIKVDPPHALIIDLGIAEICSGGGRLKNLAGTPTTMAPEIWRGDYGPKSDIFSMGCVVFTMLSGTYPFYPKKVTRDPKIWISLIQAGPNYKAVKGSSAALAFCRRLLTFQEDKRPTATQAKKDPWLTTIHNETHTAINLEPERVEALLRFRDESEVKRGVLMQAISQMSASSIPELTGLFKQVADTGERASAITVQEATKWIMSFKVDEVLARETAQALDLDHSGEIEFSEFLCGCMALFDNKIELILKTAFRSIDTDNSGEISSAELHNLLAKIGGEGLTSKESEDGMLKQIDRDGDGIITYDEFRVFFTPEVFKVQFEYNGHSILYIKTDKGIEYRKNFVLKRICKSIRVDEYCFVYDRGVTNHSWNGEKHKLPEGRRDRLISNLRILCQIGNIEFFDDYSSNKEPSPRIATATNDSSNRSTLKENQENINQMKRL